MPAAAGGPGPVRATHAVRFSFPSTLCSSLPSACLEHSKNSCSFAGWTWCRIASKALQSFWGQSHQAVCGLQRSTGSGGCAGELELDVEWCGMAVAEASGQLLAEDATSWRLNLLTNCQPSWSLRAAFLQVRQAEI